MAGILDNLLGTLSNTVQPDALRQLQSELRDALDKAPLDLNEFGCVFPV